MKGHRNLIRVIENQDTRVHFLKQMINHLETDMKSGVVSLFTKATSKFANSKMDHIVMQIHIPEHTDIQRTSFPSNEDIHKIFEDTFYTTHGNDTISIGFAFHPKNHELFRGSKEFEMIVGDMLHYLIRSILLSKILRQKAINYVSFDQDTLQSIQKAVREVRCNGSNPTDIIMGKKDFDNIAIQNSNMVTFTNDRKPQTLMGLNVNIEEAIDFLPTRKIIVLPKQKFGSIKIFNLTIDESENTLLFYLDIAAVINYGEMIAAINIRDNL
jgi:hypothetical protein